MGGEDEYVAFNRLTVTDSGAVSLNTGEPTLQVGNTGCIRGIGNYNRRRFGGHWAAWQRNSGSGWTEVSGSTQEGGICGYDL